MPDLRLIRAEILKLRRRTGMVAVCAVLTVFAVALFYACWRRFTSPTPAARPRAAPNTSTTSSPSSRWPARSPA